MVSSNDINEKKGGIYAISKYMYIFFFLRKQDYFGKFVSVNQDWLRTFGWVLLFLLVSSQLLVV